MKVWHLIADMFPPMLPIQMTHCGDEAEEDLVDDLHRAITADGPTDDHIQIDTRGGKTIELSWPIRAMEVLGLIL